MSLPDDALRTAVLKTLADDVEAALKDGKTVLEALMDGMGVKSLTAKLPDGTEVGTVTRAGGKTSPRITDPGKFLAWVSEVHPSETEVVVRDGYRKVLLESMAKAGRAVDPHTGEAVPGVEFAETTAYLSVTFARGDVPGREHIRRAWRDGVISVPDMLALPAGGEAA